MLIDFFWNNIIVKFCNSDFFNLYLVVLFVCLGFFYEKETKLHFDNNVENP